ncbi:MAG TPA: glycosyltransferase family 4 protein [Thermoanaerobaculia bacterium]|jgi:glycosyltransferase involved in cell wall biosynthesis
MSGLRFCLPTTFYPPYHFGGDGVGVQRLARALVAGGHRVTVIHDVDAYRALGSRRARPEPPEPEGLEVVRLRSRLGALAPLLTYLTGRPLVHGATLRGVLARGRFDVVHFNNVSLVGGPGLLAYGGSLKLYEAHEHWLVCPTHVLWRHNREACTGRQCVRCVLHHGRPPQPWRYTGLLERRLGDIDAFIAKSEFSRAKHREFGFPFDMEVVPYFLPLAEAAAPRSPSPHERPFFLFVGRLEPIKGLDDVLPLFRAGGRADLLVAGSGTHEPALRRAAAGCPRVRFLGRVELDQLRRYYDHALALVVPSVGFETFGIVLIEAMRQATPVVARRIGPFPEIVARGGGLLFDDAAGLAAVIDRLLDEPGLRDELGRAGERAFREHWSEPAVVPRYLDLVRRAAERKGLTQVAAAAGRAA